MIFCSRRRLRSFLQLLYCSTGHDAVPFTGIDRPVVGHALGGVEVYHESAVFMPEPYHVGSRIEASFQVDDPVGYFRIATLSVVIEDVEMLNVGAARALELVTDIPGISAVADRRERGVAVSRKGENQEARHIDMVELEYR